MRRNPHPVEMGEDVLGDAIVENALAVDDFVLFLVEGGGVVFEELDQRTRLRSFEQDLCLAFIDAPTTLHGHIPWFEKIHSVGPKQQDPCRINSLWPTQA